MKRLCLILSVLSSFISACSPNVAPVPPTVVPTMVNTPTRIPPTVILTVTTTTTPKPTATPAPTHAPVPTAAPIAAAGDTWIRPADGMVMVYAPGGEFKMGSTKEDLDTVVLRCAEWGWRCGRGAFEMEQPAHMVALNGFWIDRTEVANRQYRKCVEAGACQAPATKCDWGEPTYGDASKKDHPVVCVSWTQAQDYCAWAGVRLPTDAEWEYAARGEKRLVYPWGNEFDCTRGNLDDETLPDSWTMGGKGCDGYERTSPVGSFPSGASWCGALDMAGNVWEWVADWYETYPSERQLNPTGPSSGWAKVLRSGTWFHNPFGVRCADRDYSRPDATWSAIGFRCAKSSQ